MKATLHRTFGIGWTLALACGAVLPVALAAQQFTSEFSIERCTFANDGRQNPYFSLQPGDQSTFEGDEDGAPARNVITVTNNTKAISFRADDGVPVSVTARTVVERHFTDGELDEVSRNWFARCQETGDVFYFGESVDLYENGRIVSHEGSWQAGQAGALPGITMPGRFLLGARYFQEIAPHVALDRAEHVAMELDVTTPDGSFEDCVKVSETTPLEPTAQEFKIYCPDIGLVQDDTLVLTDHRRN
jgi:hypothetical protein